METKDFELGPKQKEWLQALRDNPEQQHRFKLGQQFEDGTIEMCCLQKYASLTTDEYAIDEGAIGKGTIVYGFEFEVLPAYIWKALKLRSAKGNPLSENMECLAYLNDKKMTWPEIADHVEANYKEYFTGSY